MCSTSCYSIWCGVLWGLGWWVLASALVMITWNKVITVVTVAKNMKIWHALLVVATIAMLWGPMMCASKCSSFRNCTSDTWQCSPDSCR